jgi:MFS family permease
MSEGHSPSAWKLALSFTFALIVANVSGAQYVYPSFGTALAERFHWSALENSFVSTATFLGVSFSGPLCARIVETFGIANALRVAAGFGFTGFILLSQTFAGHLPHAFILCVFYLLLVGIGGATGYLVALDSQASATFHHLLYFPHTP